MPQCHSRLSVARRRATHRHDSAQSGWCARRTDRFSGWQERSERRDDARYRVAGSSRGAWLIVERNDVLAELPMEQTRTTGYRVFPYLARIHLPNRWRIAEREIAEILDIKLRELTRPDAHDKMIGRFPNWHKAEQVSFYHVGAHRLWGLSHRILQPVIPRLIAGEWDV